MDPGRWSRGLTGVACEITDLAIDSPRRSSPRAPLEGGPIGRTQEEVRKAHSPPGFEAKLWATADKQRAHRDATEYKHVVLGRVYGQEANSTTWRSILLSDQDLISRVATVTK